MNWNLLNFFKLKPKYSAETVQSIIKSAVDLSIRECLGHDITDEILVQKREKIMEFLQIFAKEISDMKELFDQGIKEIEIHTTLVNK